MKASEKLLVKKNKRVLIISLIAQRRKEQLIVVRLASPSKRKSSLWL